MKRISKEPDVRRQELMDIGFELYMKGGGEGFSIKDVVRRADVATGLFYYYFKSKEAFIDEVLNGFIVKNMVAIEQILHDDQLTIIQKLQASLDVFWAFTEKLAPYKNEDSFQTMQHFQLEQKILTQMQAPLQKLIENGVKKNLFHTENPRLAAGFIVYGLSSVAHSKELMRDGNNEKEVMNVVLSILKYQEENEGEFI